MRAAFTQKVVNTYSAKRGAALVAHFKKNGTWQCPTLVALNTLWDDDDAHYTPEDLLWARSILQKDRDLIRMMQGTGLGILAGADLPPNAKNGTLQDELAGLVDAGLTPMQALETATHNPAEFLGDLSEFGTIEVDHRDILRISDILQRICVQEHHVGGFPNFFAGKSSPASSARFRKSSLI